MVVYILLLTLFFLIIWFYFVNGLSLVSPAIAFTLPFGFAVINLIFNIKRWSVELQWSTYLVIVVGIFSFYIGTEIIRYISKKRRIKGLSALHNTQISIANLKRINISTLSASLFFAFQMISFVFCLYAISRVAARNGFTGNIISRIAGYKYLGTFTTRSTSLGRIGNLLYGVCTASGYVWAYILVYQFVQSKKPQKIVILNAVASIAINLIKGGRQSAIQLLVAGGVFFLLLQMITKKRKRMSLKQLFVLALISVAVIGSFQWVGGVFGRVSRASFSHYIAIYLSAPIYNLDHFLRGSHSLPSIFGKMTFVRLITDLGSKLHISEWIYPLDLPYLRANGYSTGNVYTTFYAYIYDFGYPGIIVLPFIMGVISQMIFETAKRALQKRDGKIHVSVMVYGFIYYMLAFSFFSNKFYEGVVTIGFVTRMIYWFIIIWFLERLSISIKAKSPTPVK